MLTVVLIAWILLGISVVDTVAMLWLGATVLLNAERRTAGVWLVGSGLLMGGAFFACHALLLGWSSELLGPAMEGWWVLGWVPGVLLPLSWYVAMLWHTGYWLGAKSDLKRRHRFGLPGASLLAAGVLGLFLLSPPVTTGVLGARVAVPAAPSPVGVPFVAVVYPFFLLLCVGLALDVLAHPGPSARVMGDLARRRARPWLVATSVVLLLVSLVVGGILPWLALQVGDRGIEAVLPGVLLPLAWADLVVASLITLAVLLLGEAIVSYELFTGKTLPRRGLRRQWRTAVALGLCCGAVSLLSAAYGLSASGALLLMVVLVSLLYAFWVRGSFAEHERSVRHLRPFIGGAGLYDALLAGDPSRAVDAGAEGAFGALCVDVLGARQACLQALGPAAPLFGPALTHPQGAPSPAGTEHLAARARSADVVCLPVEQGEHEGFAWAVPLWSRGGVSGLLLLGEKEDGGLYAQEEMEIARATGERLVDLRMGATIAERLMALQRRRLAEAQALDQGTRRELHDEVLPRLHAVILALSTGTPEAARESVAPLSEVHRAVSALLRSLPAARAPQTAQLGLVEALRRAVGHECPDAFAHVHWSVDEGAEARARALSPMVAEVLFQAAREAVRNAARYAGGEGARPVTLRVAVECRNGLEVTVEDDGVGLDAAAGGQGSGQGLALHGTMMAVVGGELSVESVPDEHTRIRLSLPEGAAGLPHREVPGVTA